MRGCCAQPARYPGLRDSRFLSLEGQNVERGEGEKADGSRQSLSKRKVVRWKHELGGERVLATKTKSSDQKSREDGETTG